MWKDRQYRGQIEIEVRHDAGWSVTMELVADSTEQILRPAQGGSVGGYITRTGISGWSTCLR